MSEQVPFANAHNIFLKVSNGSAPCEIYIITFPPPVRDKETRLQRD